MQRIWGVFVIAAAGLPGGAVAGIVKGPFLQDVRTDRITVACETDTGGSCSVQWGEGLVHSTGLDDLGGHHEGVVSGLAPSTCYSYRVTCGTDASETGSFCTAPLPGEPFSFVVLGDTRSNHAEHQAIVNRVMAEGVDFVINTGDLVASGEVEQDWVYFFEAEDPLLLTTPLYPVVGNHDEDSGNLDVYERLFAPPTDSSGAENHYSFTYGNARFVVLDNQSTSVALQKTWAMSEIDAARIDPAIDHIFVFLHANMYSSKDGRGGDWVFRGWKDDLRNKGVNVVFGGHDHYYERGEADNGLVYYITGGGGAGLYDTANPTEGDPVDIYWTLACIVPCPHTIHYSKSLHHYVRIDIHGPAFLACAKDSTGVCFDPYTYGELPDQDGGVDAGFDGGVDAGTDAGADPGADAGADAGTDAGTDTGSCDCTGEPLDPVCGEDGVTYDNLCELDCAQMGMDHHGECGGTPDCESECPSEVHEVCGLDGTTYTNSCFLECAGAGFDHEGPCGDPCDLCPGGGEPVCGKDGTTYPNLCRMECVGVELDHEGACDVTPDCSQCPDTDDPVCGKDGRTYKNECLMTCMRVELDHSGPCAGTGGGSGCGCTTRAGGPDGRLMLIGLLLPAWRRRRRV